MASLLTLALHSTQYDGGNVSEEAWGWVCRPLPAATHTACQPPASRQQHRCCGAAAPAAAAADTADHCPPGCMLCNTLLCRSQHAQLYFSPAHTACSSDLWPRPWLSNITACLPCLPCLLAWPAENRGQLTATPIASLICLKPSWRRGGATTWWPLAACWIAASARCRWAGGACCLPACCGRNMCWLTAFAAQPSSCQAPPAPSRPPACLGRWPPQRGRA